MWKPTRHVREREEEHEQLLPARSHWESIGPMDRDRGHEYGYSDEGLLCSTSIRRDTWAILRYRTRPPQRTYLRHALHTFEGCVIILVFMNVVLAMGESAAMAKSSSTPYFHPQWYDPFLYISTVVFTAEYMIRLWSCIEDERFHGGVVGRIKWMIRPMSIIDLIVLLPFYLEIVSEHQLFAVTRGAVTLRGMRLMRVMSFLRLERSYNSLKNLREIFVQKREELWIVSYMTGLIVVTASTIIFFLENQAQPEVFSSIGVCAWWSIQTITSLGYGDIVPVTSGGRVFSSALALWGIMLFTIPGAVIGSGFVEVMLKRQEQEKRTFEEQLCQSFPRELLAVTSSAYDACSSPNFMPQSITPPASQSDLLQLQEQVNQLTRRQEQTHAQLREQTAQLTAILALLDGGSRRPARSQDLPPFSEIVVSMQD